MTTAVDHPFSRILNDAAHNVFPAYSRTVEAVGALPGPCDAVMFLPGHAVVAADVDQKSLDDAIGYQRNRPPEDPSTGLGIGLAALREKLGHPPMYASVLTVAPHRAALLRGKLHEHDEPADPGWAAYRRQVRCHRYEGRSTQGHIDVGRGPGDRLDVFVQVDSSAQGGGGPSRELLAAALTMVPSGEQLYGSAPVHDTRALRTMLAGGFTPICTEVLFLTRPER